MKIDLKKDRKDLYQPRATGFTEVTVPPMTYLAFNGHGDPNTSNDYSTAVEALYAGAYAIRFAFKARTGGVFVVGPLEGLWSSSDPTTFTEGRKADWDWTMLIALPDPVSTDDIESGLRNAAKKKPDLPTSGLHALVLDEGRSLQILHIGRYDDEAPTLARLHLEVMPARGVTWNGRHHEIYLSDPRRVPSEKLKTVLRQPVKPVA